MGEMRHLDGDVAHRGVENHLRCVQLVRHRNKWNARETEARALNENRAEREGVQGLGFRVESLGWVYTRVQAQWHPIGREQNHGSKEFTLGYWSKVWKNDVALMWHHFPSKCGWFHLKRVIFLVGETNSKVGSSLESKNKSLLRGVLDHKFLRPELEFKHVLNCIFIFEWNMTSFVIMMDTELTCVMMRHDNMLKK